MNGLLRFLKRLNFAGFVGTWLVFFSLNFFDGLLLYATSFRGFALADTFRALLIDALIAIPALFLSRKKYIWYTTIGFALLLVASIANTFHILTFQAGISTYAIFAVIETTASEALEFSSTQFSVGNLLIILSSMVLPCLLFFKVLRTERLFEKKSVIAIGTVLFIATFFVANTAVQQGYRFLSSHPGYLAFWSVGQYYRLAQNASKEQTVPEGIFGKIETQEGPQTYVIVVGEAANKNHMGIYGYPRQNTPHAQQDGWLAFTDVISPAAYTIPALNHALRFAELEQDGMQPSIIDLFNAAGFKTFWFSNQMAPIGSHNILEKMTARANKQVYINLSRTGGKSTTYDGDLLPHLKKALKDPAEKKVIFLHFLGSHMTYALRYPRSVAQFPMDSLEGLTPKKWFDGKAIERINHYDNSIAYTDQVLHTFLQEVKQTTGPTFFFYFSDHGQDVFDSRYIQGNSERNLTRHMVEIPMFMWLSPQHRKQHPEIAKFLEANLDRPYSTKSLSGTIAKLAAIRSEKLENVHSFFSPGEETNRQIYGRPYTDLLDKAVAQ